MRSPSLLAAFALAACCLACGTQNPPAAQVGPLQGAACFYLLRNDNVQTFQLLFQSDSVSGSFQSVLKMVDTTRGSLSGRRNANGEYELLLSHEGDSLLRTVACIVKVEKSGLYVKVGEMQAPQQDGNYRYADPAAATYEHFPLQRVACAAEQ